MVEKEIKGISKLADDLFRAIEPIDRVGEIQEKVSTAGWRCLIDQRGIYFIIDDVLTGYRKVISLEGVKTLRVREYLPNSDGEMPPARKDRYISIIGVYPMYKINPVFDELMSMGIESGISVEELTNVLEELNLLLY